MSPLSIFEFVFEAMTWLFCSWRTWGCFFVSVLLAAVVTSHITAEPLNWIVAGAIVLGGALVGRRWENGVS